MYGSERLHEMRVGRVVWLYGSEGLQEMKGWMGGLSGYMGQRDYMR